MNDENSNSPTTTTNETETTPELATQDSAAVTSDTAPATQRQFFKLSDDLIGMVRELIQLSLLTGTNIVDHMRAIVCEASPEDSRYVTVAPEYVVAYNQQIETLNKQAEAEMIAMQGKLASDDEGPPPANAN